jgi:hypothetical protein
MSPSLAGAFSSGKGLGETKEQKRQALERAEIEHLAAPPAWAPPDLLDAMCAAAKGSPPVSLADAPIDCHDAILRARAIGKLKSEATGRTWWVVTPPKLQASKASEEVVLCLGLREDRMVCGAIGWFAAGALKATGASLRAADATRIVTLSDETHHSCGIGHSDLIVTGEECRVTPAMSELDAPMPLQLCESVRMFLTARAQVSARLQRRGASDAEKHHVRVLFAEAYRRLVSAATAEELPLEVLNRSESAFQALRKQYLPQEWEDRCVECGCRHFGIERGSCKFWVTFKAEAAAAAEEVES